MVKPARPMPTDVGGEQDRRVRLIWPAEVPSGPERRRLMRHAASMDRLQQRTFPTARVSEATSLEELFAKIEAEIGAANGDAKPADRAAARPSAAQ
jgi:hypothetical protein